MPGMQGFEIQMQSTDSLSSSAGYLKGWIIHYLQHLCFDYKSGEEPAES